MPSNKSVYLSSNRDLLKVALLEPNYLPITAIGNCNYCRTSITHFNKNVYYNTNGIRDWKELMEISQQRYLSQTERFRTKNALDVWKHIGEGGEQSTLFLHFHPLLPYFKSKHAQNLSHNKATLYTQYHA